jgi:hypothetical protein
MHCIQQALEMLQTGLSFITPSEAVERYGAQRCKIRDLEVPDP